jgi:hypothetical protein
MSEDRSEDRHVSDALFRCLEECEMPFSGTLFCGEGAARYIGVTVGQLDGLSATNPLLRPVDLCGRLAWRRCDLEKYLQSLPEIPKSCRLFEYDWEMK